MLLQCSVLFSLQPLKWELKQKPGISPPRGGFKPDDPNQQIVADDIFDEYGGIVYSSRYFEPHIQKRVQVPTILHGLSLCNRISEWW